MGRSKINIPYMFMNAYWVLSAFDTVLLLTVCAWFKEGHKVKYPTFCTLAVVCVRTHV